MGSTGLDVYKDGSEAGVEHLAQFPEHNRVSFSCLTIREDTAGPLLDLSSQKLLKLIFGRAFPPSLLTILSDFCFYHSSLANDGSCILNIQLYNSNLLSFKNAENHTHSLSASISVSSCVHSLLEDFSSISLMHGCLRSLPITHPRSSSLHSPTNQFLFLFPPLHLYCQHPVLGPHHHCPVNGLMGVLLC